MKKAAHWTRTKIIIATSFVIICLVGLIIWCWPVFQHHQTMGLARDHIPVIKGTLKEHEKYSQIYALPFTPGRGGIILKGVVDSLHDLEKLQTLVDATKPPVDVYYYIECPDSPEPWRGIFPE